MSWHGFKKAVNRAGIQVMQKTGVIEKTSDAEFDHEERCIRDRARQVERVQKEGKACLDAMKILASNKVRNDLAALGLTANDMPRYQEMWTMIEQLMSSELDPSLRQVLLQPTVRLGEAVKKAQEGVKKRANKLLDYDQARSKSKRAAHDPTKQQRAEADEHASKHAFEQLDEALKTDLPKLHQVTERVLQESVEAAHRLQGLFAREVSDGLQYIPEPPDAPHQQMASVMDRIRQLTIATQALC